MKKFIIILLVIAVIGGGAYYFFTKNGAPAPVSTIDTTATTTATTTQAQIDAAKAEQLKNAPELSIGKSVKGNDIMAYRYGTGDTELLFVGGIHGGYEWNTVLEAYQLMDYLKANPTSIPANIKVTVIPVLNPDGLNDVVGTTSRFTAANVTSNQVAVVEGRFNANDVDLNRNFDCDWKSSGTWQDKAVSGGASAFSEPETQAMKNYVETYKPSAVVAWFSSAGGVYSSDCGGGILPETATINSLYANASGYPSYPSFTDYETSGDMTNWLAKNNIPAISVLLTNHTSTEWTKNQAGVLALLKYYAK